ncbi:hypothetical protein D3C87_163770 [compost metagenome]
MEKIPFNTVQTAIDNICGIESEQDLEQVSQKLFDAQPDLAGFFMEFIDDMSDEAKDLGFMMALILWRAFEDQYKDLRALTEDEVISSFEAREAELESYLQIDDDMITRLQEQESTSGGQPEVLNYIIEELFMSPDLEPALEQDEQIHLFMICKFFADSLHSLAKESAPDLVKH